MSLRRYDAVVVGGGHNGLTAAAYLARAGLETLVLERRERLGGATLTEEALPGFRYSVFSYLVSLLRPEVIHELDLVRHGLVLLPMESTFNPLPDGDYLLREADPWRTYHNLRRHNPHDAEAYPEYKIAMHHMAQLMYRVQSVAPPDLQAEGVTPDSAHEWVELGRWLGAAPREQVDLLLRMLTASAEEFLGRWFESDALKAALSTSSTIGSFVSPRSPGSAYVLLHHYMGEIDGVYRAWAFPKGGTGAVAEAIARAAQAHGVTIRTEAPVARLLTRDGVAVEGVVLESGEEIESELVLSSLAPRPSLVDLPPEGSMPLDLVADVERWRDRGCSGKVNLSLDGLPEFSALPGRGRHLAGGISIAPSLDYIERAFDDARDGRWAREPFLDMVFLSVVDPDMAPPGQHTLSCFVQYAPYELEERPWDDAREAFGDAAVDVLERYLPGIRDRILDRQVLTPVDIERIVGIPGGNIFHGELELSQLFGNRPSPRVPRYHTPLEGYYLCGSATHPGGGISGAPGRLAARQVLADRARAGAGT